MYTFGNSNSTELLLFSDRRDSTTTNISGTAKTPDDSLQISQDSKQALYLHLMVETFGHSTKFTSFNLKILAARDLKG